MELDGCSLRRPNRLMIYTVSSLWGVGIVSGSILLVTYFMNVGPIPFFPQPKPSDLPTSCLLVPENGGASRWRKGEITIRPIFLRDRDLATRNILAMFARGYPYFPNWILFLMWREFEGRISARYLRYIILFAISTD